MPVLLRKLRQVWCERYIQCLPLVSEAHMDISVQGDWMDVSRFADARGFLGAEHNIDYSSVGVLQLKKCQF